MPQSLSVGITSTQPGWKRVLEQEGIPFKQCSFQKKTKPWQFACIIVNSLLEKKQLQNARRFLKEGGAVLSTPKFAKSLDPSTKFSEKSTSFLEPKGQLFHRTGLTWLNQKAATFQGQKSPIPIEKRIGKGFLIALPFDLNKAILNQGSEKRGFFAKKAFPAEISSLASKQNIRIIAANCLKRLFQLRNLPFLHTWYYPNDFQSVFCFHIDVDNSSKDCLHAIALMKGLGLKPTWFLNMSEFTKKGNEKILKELLKQSFVSQHGFQHKAFGKPAQNLQNLIRGHQALKKLGAKPGSFSAPNGIWNKGIALALEKLNYRFAIAFSLGNDNLPFKPILQNKEASFLFLPSHPICIGILKAYDFNEKEMIEYFQEVIDRNLKANLPLLFYGHPLKRIARFPNAIKNIVKQVRKNPEIWETTHRQFVDWWNKRNAISFNASFNGSTIKINCSKQFPDASISLFFKGEHHFLPAKTQTVNIQELGNGKQPFQGFLQDTCPKPSSLGKKHLAKKAAGKALNLIKKIKKG